MSMKAYELNIGGRDLLLALAETGPGHQIIDLPIGDNNISAGRYIVFNAELLIEWNDLAQFLTGKYPQSQLFTDYASFKMGIILTPIAHLPSAPTSTSSSAPAPWAVSPTLVASVLSQSRPSSSWWGLSAGNLLDER
jgi:hypothetical protein